MGGDLCSDGSGFECQRWMDMVTLIGVQNNTVCLQMTENKQKVTGSGPFLARRHLPKYV